MSFGPDPRNNPAAKDIVAEFRAKNFEPEAYTLYSYAAMQIMKEAAEKTKSLDPKKMAEFMHSGVTFNTVIGNIAYDKKGDRTSVDYVWYVWEKGPRRQDHLRAAEVVNSTASVLGEARRTAGLFFYTPSPACGRTWREAPDEGLRSTRCSLRPSPQPSPASGKGGQPPSRRLR